MKSRTTEDRLIARLNLRTYLDGLPLLGYAKEATEALYAEIERAHMELEFLQPLPDQDRQLRGCGGAPPSQTPPVPAELPS